MSDIKYYVIDVEGGEYNILPNSTYLQSVPWIDIEFHKFDTIPTKSYVAEHFPNHQIALIENTFSEDENGRCLLKLKS